MKLFSTKTKLLFLPEEMTSYQLIQEQMVKYCNNTLFIIIINNRLLKEYLPQQNAVTK